MLKERKNRKRIQSQRVLFKKRERERNKAEHYQGRGKERQKNIRV